MVQNIPDWLKNPTLISLQCLALNLSVKTIWTKKVIKEQILRGNNNSKYRVTIKKWISRGLYSNGNGNGSGLQWTIYSDDKDLQAPCVFFSTITLAGVT